MKPAVICAPPGRMRDLSSTPHKQRILNEKSKEHATIVMIELLVDIVSEQANSGWKHLRRLTTLTLLPSVSSGHFMPVLL